MQSLLRVVVDGTETTLGDIYEPLPRAVIISLFTWRRAEANDMLPSIDRMGWWGDTHPAIEGDRIGSRLWLLTREKITSATLARAKEHAEEALQWLIDDGVADSVTVEVERQGLDRVALGVLIVRGDKTRLNLRFIDVWNFAPQNVPVYVPPPIITDPYFANVTLLLHGSGLNGSTPANIDIKGHSALWNGNAHIDTTVLDPFGTSNGVMSFDGTGDWIQFAQSIDWYFVGGDFCVEFWAKSPGNGLYDQIIAQRDSAGNTGPLNPWFFTRNSNTQTLWFGFYDSSLVRNIDSVVPVFDNTWHHIAGVRNGPTFTNFVDGISMNTATYTGELFNSTEVLSVGRSGAYNGQYFKGQLSNLRITKGVARYTSNFSVPIAPFPIS